MRLRDGGIRVYPRTGRVEGLVGANGSGEGRFDPRRHPARWISAQSLSRSLARETPPTPSWRWSEWSVSYSGDSTPAAVPSRSRAGSEWSPGYATGSSARYAGRPRPRHMDRVGPLPSKRPITTTNTRAITRRPNTITNTRANTTPSLTSPPGANGLAAQTPRRKIGLAKFGEDAINGGQVFSG